MRIRTKLNVGFGLLIVLYTVATFVFLSTLQGSYQRTLERHAGLFSSQIQSRVDRSVIMYRDQLAMLGRTPRVQRMLTGAASDAERAALAEWIETNILDYSAFQYGSPLFTAVELFKASGEAVLEPPPRERRAAIEELWWRRTLNTGFSLDQMGGPLDADAATGAADRVRLRLSVLIKNTNNDPVGVVSGVIDFLTLMKTAELQAKPFDSTILTVVSQEGRILYRSIPFVLYENVTDEPFFEAMNADSGVFTIGDTARLYAYSTFGLGTADFNQPWRFVISYSLSEALSGMISARRQLFGLLAVILVMAAGISLWIYRGIKGPLDHLVQAVERVGSQDLSYRPRVPGRDEVSIVIQRFDLMREKLQYFYNTMKEDAREQREQRKEAEAIAGTDELTRLFNRRAFFDFLGHRIEYSAQTNAVVGVIYFDLNGFKPINDTHGHAFGDYVLQTIGRRLIATTREGDLAARVGGDEFAVVLTGVADAAGAEEAAWRLVETMSEQIHHNDHDLSVGVSAGVALYPQHGHSSDTLVDKADKAMYQAKASLGADRTATGSALRLSE